MAALDQSKINHKVIEKTKFSMITDDTISYLNLPATQPSPTEPPTPEPQNFILTGLESHVCVLQTCQDLIALGHHVFLVVDAVESRSQYDKTFAIKRLEKLGVEILTHESLIFDLLGDKNHENFKFCSSLVRELLHE